MVDDALADAGLARIVQYKVANFSSAPYIVEDSDAIFTAPRKFIHAVTSRFNVTEFETPCAIKGYAMKLYWNIRNKDDQAINWLKTQIVSVTGARV
ncbi:hypothetical protein L1286_05255 [Pseudoalteromonas sp. SMS1]|uniref:hypothetical protein n=1 Tax=Pseudoalteromonas sp. SMS1 TaxID=2908894 RepID=UPI001F33E528|nr:hypothetical protein [Pseudoalteromonas sp. SMS1]MCF2856867.1 hypothetical protein [Pseudoalteromonas sp. SMS1]